MGVIGREFKIASILHNNVFISSNVNRPIELVFIKCLLVDLTAASHRPPKCGAAVIFHLEI